MTKLAESVTSPVAREDAFDYIADWSRQAEWDPNTVKSSQIGEGGPAVGARYQLDVKMGNRTVPMEYRITELEAPSRLVLIGEGSGIWTEDIITFSDVDGGTRIDYEAEIKLSGFLGLIQPLLGRAFASIARGAVAGMQAELDKLAASDDVAAAS